MILCYFVSDHQTLQQAWRSTSGGFTCVPRLRGEHHRSHFSTQFDHKISTVSCFQTKQTAVV